LRSIATGDSGEQGTFGKEHLAETSPASNEPFASLARCAEQIQLAVRTGRTALA
jgi:hypothetical protein